MASEENTFWNVGSKEEENEEREWLISSIRRAKSMERLDSLAGTIAWDAEHKVPYTLDAEHMSVLRSTYSLRKSELTGNGGNNVNGIIREGHIPADVGDGAECQDTGRNS